MWCEAMPAVGGSWRQSRARPAVSLRGRDKEVFIQQLASIIGWGLLGVGVWMHPPALTLAEMPGRATVPVVSRGCVMRHRQCQQQGTQFPSPASHPHPHPLPAIFF